MPEHHVDRFRTATGRWLVGSLAGWGTLLLCLVGVGLVVVLVRWLRALATTYEVTDQRLILHRGLVMKTVDEIELYRIKDVRLDYSLLNQMVDIGTITLTSTDRTTGDGVFVLRDVPMARGAARPGRARPPAPRRPRARRG